MNKYNIISLHILFNPQRQFKKKDKEMSVGH